ncbi:MAG TPA: DUF6543 domain-containing protein [Pseudomonas sp.]|jgi:hypothetical protein
MKEDPNSIKLKQLKALRASPAMRLVADPALFLKAWQLDMDFPPALDDYLRGQLIQLLRKATGRQLNPDQLILHFTHDTDPAVDDNGEEQWEWRVSLTDLAVFSFNAPALLELRKSMLADTVLHQSATFFTARDAMKMVMDAQWAEDYTDLIAAFWAKHDTTYRALAKLSFLHDLQAHYTQKKISREGYFLTLNALGLKAFPTDPGCLEQTATGTNSSVCLLSLNGQPIPTALQVRSHSTSHCFIHTLGRQAQPVEYISDDPQHMTQRLVDALNASGLSHLFEPGWDQEPSTPALYRVAEDIFSAITRAQRGYSFEFLKSDSISELLTAYQTQLLNPIRQALALISAVDLWQSQPNVLRRIPAPLKTAARVMRQTVKARHNLDVNPDHVFIRYIPGTSMTPLGNARVPVTQVSFPDTKPISLSQALISNYRVAQVQGYIDHGGQTHVYIDDTDNGYTTQPREIPLSAQDIENHIREIDFLSLMSRRIEHFWNKQQCVVEQALETTFVTQAVRCLKSRLLFQTGFDMVIKAVEQLRVSASHTVVQWSVLGFYLQHYPLQSADEYYCANLLVLSLPDKPQRVLYQAGVPKSFIEFGSDQEITDYLKKATQNTQWRESLLNYVPVRHHQRLSYILQIWAGQRGPSEPVSILRPGTDVLYNHDAHKAMAHERCIKPLEGAPFRYLSQTLKQNGLWDVQDMIVTSKEVLLGYWTRQLSHLQLLLAPMSLLLTPALIATFAAELGIVALNIASAHLPGARYEEKRQAMLAALSLALLQLAPHTPRLLSAFKTLTYPTSTTSKVASIATRNNSNFGAFLSRSMQHPKTKIERFFDTDSLLKTWDIPGNASFGTLPVKAWKLAGKFLLWTSDRAKSRTLVVSTHGYYFPWSKNTLIPNGTELSVYVLHGYQLIDPGLHRVVRQQAKPFAILDNQASQLPISPTPTPPYSLAHKSLAGTSQPGMIKNYSLSKFQTPHYENYQDISRIVRDSNQPPWPGLPAVPMDVLTVRNRFGTRNPTLEDLFNELFERGIHYDKILLLHCRCSAFKAVVGTAPVYRAM